MDKVIKMKFNAIYDTLHIEILEGLRDGPLERDRLSYKIGRPRSTVYDNLKQMRTMGLVESYEYDNSLPGRPKVIWRLKE